MARRRPGRQPLRQPRHHRRHRAAPAVRRFRRRPSAPVPRPAVRDYLVGLSDWEDTPVTAEAPSDAVSRGALAAAQDAAADVAWLQGALSTDVVAWADDFGAVRDVTALETEQNALRYDTVPVTIRLEQATPAEAIRVIAAGVRTGARLSVSSAEELPASIRTWLRGLSIGIAVEDEKGWGARAARLAESGGRIRLVGGDARLVAEHTGGSPAVAIYAGPVVSGGPDRTAALPARAGRLDLVAPLRHPAPLRDRRPHVIGNTDETPTPTTRSTTPTAFVPSSARTRGRRSSASCRGRASSRRTTRSCSMRIPTTSRSSAIVGRPDERLHELGQHEAMVIVYGPQGYVSPSWYGSVAGRADLESSPSLTCTARRRSSRTRRNLRVLERLVAHFESPLPEPYLINRTLENADYAARIVHGRRAVPDARRTGSRRKRR